MRALAAYVMRGNAQAVLAATVLAMLSVLMTPLSIASSAVIALVTLRNGPQQGSVVTALSLLAVGLLLMLIFGSVDLAAGFALIYWLPMLLLATVLRNWRRLSLALETALALALLAGSLVYLLVGNPAAEWAGFLEQPLRTLLADQAIDEARFAEVLAAVGNWMTPVLIAGGFMQLTASLLLARWWQAMLYNPGGFRQEFHALRLHPRVAIVALAAYAATLLGDTPEWLYALGLTLTVALCLQGLSLAHALLARVNANPFWLVGIYALTLLAMPHMVVALALAGFGDMLLDVRSKVASRQGPKGPPGDAGN